MKELSKAIYDHLIKVAKNTKIEGKIEPKGKKSMVAPATATALAKNNLGLVHVPGTPEEVVEINGHLFFFFHPATIVRWPKEGLEFKDFTVRIEPRGNDEDMERQLKDKAASGLTNLALTGPFKGEFWIDDDGTLHLVQPAGGTNPETGKPFGIDIVLLGNPGPEQGTNGPC